MNNEPLKPVEKPNFSPIPNVILDDWMPKISISAFLVAMAIARKTYGWHKPSDAISLSQLCKMTNLSKAGVVNGVNELLAHGVVKVTKANDGKTPTTYELVVGSPLDRQVPVHKIDNPTPEGSLLDRHTKESVLKKEEKKKDLSPKGDSVLSTDLSSTDAKPLQPVTPKQSKPKTGASALAWDLRPIVQEVLQCHGGMVGKIAATLTGCSTTYRESTALFKAQPVTPDELRDFGKWYRAKYNGANMPASPDKVANHLAQYRKTRPAKIVISGVQEDSTPAPLPADDSGEEMAKNAPNLFAKYERAMNPHAHLDLSDIDDSDTQF